MKELMNPGGKPRIVVSDTDYDRLTDLAAGVWERFPEMAEALQSEMDRAEVVSADSMPAQVVQMGSTVEFRSDAGQDRCVTLVFPAEADISANKISILTPIGTALIGLSTGQSINWTTREGLEHELTIVSVEQPVSTATV